MDLRQRLKVQLGSLAPELRELLRGLLSEDDSSTVGDSSSGAPPSKIYRQRIYHLVPYGHFDEVLSLCEELNQRAQARGGTGGMLWIPTIGQQNELIVEFEFYDLGSWERGRAASNNDPEWTKIVRKIGEAVVPGSVRTELVETAPRLA